MNKTKWQKLLENQFKILLSIFSGLKKKKEKAKCFTS